MKNILLTLNVNEIRFELNFVIV